MTAALRTPKLSRASVRGKSKRGQLAATYRDRAGLLEDDFGPVTEDDMITEKQARFDLASSIPGYAAWFKANRPDEYAEWLKTGASDRITTSTSTQCTATLEGSLGCKIQGILEASERLCLPAPKVEVVALMPRWTLTTQREMGDIAWLAFGEVLDAWKIEFCEHTGFVSVYDINMAAYEEMTWDGLTIKTGNGRLTFYGAQPLLLKRLPDFKVIGKRVSNIVRDEPLRPDLKYHYTWKPGWEEAILRKEYREKSQGKVA